MKAEIFNYRTWIKTTVPEEIEKDVTGLLDEAGFKVLKKVNHHFQPVGYTGVWLLAESHLAIHSFPESDKTYLELASCNKAKTDRFIDLIAKKGLVIETKAHLSMNP